MFITLYDVIFGNNGRIRKEIMNKLKIERKNLNEVQKEWILWKDKTPQERLQALEKLRKTVFAIQKYGKKQ